MSDTPHPVPEDNQPGHHPEVEQDKPVGPPPIPGRRGTPARTHRWPLRRDEPLATASRVFGVTPDNAYVEFDDETLNIAFGPWHLRTPLSNVETIDVTGPFAWWKVIGPPHVSLKDRGVTFATSAREAVCIRFREPVPAIEPRGVIRHPGATVTVENPKEVARLLKDAC